MTKAYDIVGYTYKADQFCTDCIREQVIASLPEELQVLAHPVDSEGGEYPWDAEWFLDQVAPHLDIEDRMDERTFDSDDFPKVIFSTQVEDTEHCGNPECEETL